MVHYINSLSTTSSRNEPKPDPKQIYTVSEPPYSGYHPVDQSTYRKSSPDSAIVIDNGIYAFQLTPPPFSCTTLTWAGSSSVRAGWQFEQSPRLVIPPLMARYTDRKLNRKLTFIGSELYFDGTARGQAKNIYEAGSNIVNNWDVQEGVLDYIFIKLGMGNANGAIDRPVVMTEPLANTAYTRRGE